MEKKIVCTDGLMIAIKHWKPKKDDDDDDDDEEENEENEENEEDPQPRVICLHGFLDNCESFHHLGPALMKAGIEVVAMDFPGHGLSDHKPASGPPQLLSESAFYVKEVVDELGWSAASGSYDVGFSIVGHSMGAGLALLFAAMYHDEVEKVVLLEGVGPRALPAHSLAKQVRTHVEKRRTLNQTIFGNNPEDGQIIFESLEEAIKARERTARLAPGAQYLSRKTATKIITRATIPVSTLKNPPRDVPMNAVQFRHDPRLHCPSIQYFTPDQVDAINMDIRCPVCILTAEDGLPMKRVLQKALEDLRPVVNEKFPGSHHFHADPSTAPDVCEKIIAFLTDDPAE